MHDLVSLHVSRRGLMNSSLEVNAQTSSFQHTLLEIQSMQKGLLLILK